MAITNGHCFLVIFCYAGTTLFLVMWFCMIIQIFSSDAVVRSSLIFLSFLTNRVCMSKSQRFGELAVNINFPVFSVVKRWRVSHSFMLQNGFISLHLVLQNVCYFFVNLILYLFISHASQSLNIIENA